MNLYRLLYGGNTVTNVKYEPENKCVRIFGEFITQKDGLLSYMTNPHSTWKGKLAEKQ